MTIEFQMTKPEKFSAGLELRFVIRAWEFFRHSVLIIRNFLTPFEHPLVFLEPLERADDGLLDGERGLPAGRADFFGVEKDERIVAHPAFVAAGIFQFRFKAEHAANEFYRAVYFNIFIRAKVVGLDMVPGLLRCSAIDHVQHRIKAITDVKIGFPLCAVAQDFQVTRVGKQLFVKIKHVAVGVAFAKNRNKTEDVALKAVALAISVNE